MHHVCPGIPRSSAILRTLSAAPFALFWKQVRWSLSFLSAGTAIFAPVCEPASSPLFCETQEGF